MRDGPGAANEDGEAAEADVEEAVEGQRSEAQEFSGGARSGGPAQYHNKNLFMWSINTGGISAPRCRTCCALIVDGRGCTDRLLGLLRLRVDYLWLGLQVEGDGSSTFVERRKLVE